MIRCRIAVIFEFTTLNGGERSMLSVIDCLRKTGSPIEFVAIGPPFGRLAEALNERDIPHSSWSPYEESGTRRPSGNIESSLLWLINSIRPDLVHANSLAMGRLLGRLAGRLEMPTSAHLRDIIKLSAAAVSDINQNQKLIAVSEATREYHVAQGIESSRISVIHNGLDLDRFQPRQSTGRLHEELGLQHPSNCSGGAERHRLSEHSAARLIGCIGQIGLRKGQDVIAAAAPAIVERIPGAHFLFIGERTSQKMESIEFEQNLHRRFAEAGLSERLHMLGNREDVSAILNELDLLVHPANQEPFGRVLLEASASGLPIVATDVGGTSEIVIDQFTGRLVPPRDSVALSEAVVAILSDRKWARELGENGRHRAMNQFGVDAAASKLAAAWDAVVNG